MSHSGRSHIGVIAPAAGPARRGYRQRHLHRRLLACVPVSVWLAVAGALFVFILLLVFQPEGTLGAQIIRTAVCDANKGQIDCNSSGLGGITNAADALISPILVALFAVAPIACLIGAGAVMVGSRRGIVIIASALGALVLAGAIKGIVL